MVFYFLFSYYFYYFYISLFYIVVVDKWFNSLEKKNKNVLITKNIIFVFFSFFDYWLLLLFLLPNYIALIDFPKFLRLWYIYIYKGNEFCFLFFYYYYLLLIRVDTISTKRELFFFLLLRNDCSVYKSEIERWYKKNF